MDATTADEAALGNAIDRSTDVVEVEGGMGPRFVVPTLQGVAPSLLRSWSWLFLLALVVALSIFGHGFFSLFNFQSIVLDASVLAILALGETFVVLIGGIDLSVGWVAGLAAIAAALVMNKMDGESTAFVVLVGVIVAAGIGAIAGILNGTVIESLKIHSFIITLGMYGVAQGVGLILSGGQSVSLHRSSLASLGNGYLMYYRNGSLRFFSAGHHLSAFQLRHSTGIVPNMAVLLVLLYVACWWLLRKCQWGQHIYAIGGDRPAARRAAVPVARVVVGAFVLCGLMAGLAGLVYVLQFSSGSPNAADATLLPAIAAVVIGGTSLFGGLGNVTGTLAGVLIISVIQNGLVILGFNPYWQYIAIGLVIVLAVVVDQGREKLQ